MAASEADILRDEQERGNLQRTITDLETAIAVSNPGTRAMLERSLAGVKVRVATLDKRIEEAKVERAAEVQAQVAAAAALAAKETKLNAAERETYRSFMEESYFTKKDFGRLDEFYAHSYDRLSEDGKAEMSKRINEGIKRGEFAAEELPPSVRKRLAEAKHLSARDVSEVEQNVDTAAPEVARAKTLRDREPTKLQASVTTAANEKPLDLGSLDLSGVTLVETASQPNATALPDSGRSRPIER